MGISAMADEMVRARQGRPDRARKEAAESQAVTQAQPIPAGGGGPAAPPPPPVAPAGQAGAAGVKTAVDQLTKYIPTSIVGSYLGLTALLGDQTTTLALIVFLIFWVLAPLSAVAAAAVTPGGGFVSPRHFKEIWPTLAAFVAFAIWAAALPGSTLSDHFAWLTSQVGAVAAVLGSLILAAIGRLFGTND